MRPDTAARNARRVEMAEEFIMRNLDRPIGLRDIAGECHVSPHHFHRIFQAAKGETLAGYVHRKRMERALKMLVCMPEIDITEVAERGGFSSPANFSKAFRLYFDLCPRQMRDPRSDATAANGKLLRKYGKQLDKTMFHSQEESGAKIFDPAHLSRMIEAIEIFERDERDVVFCTHIGSYDAPGIQTVWQRLLDWAEAHGIPADPDRRFAFFHDNPLVTPAPQCRYDAVIELDSSVEAPPPFVSSKRAAGTYAMAPYDGPGARMIDYFKEVNYGWLPRHGYNSDGSPLTVQYSAPARSGQIKAVLFLKIRRI